MKSLWMVYAVRIDFGNGIYRSSQPGTYDFIKVITTYLKMEYQWPLLLTWFNFNLSMDK